MAEIAGLETKDDLDAWTLRAWPKANTLAPTDGDTVRQAFQAQLTQVQSTPDEGHHQPAELDPPAKDEIRSRIDKSMLTLPETKRLRTSNICGSLRNSPAPSAAASQTRTICVCNPAVSASRSATNSRSRVPGTPSRTAPHRQGIGLVVKAGLEPIAWASLAETHPLHASADAPTTTARRLERRMMK